MKTINDFLIDFSNKVPFKLREKLIKKMTMHVLQVCHAQYNNLSIDNICYLVNGRGYRLSVYASAIRQTSDWCIMATHIHLISKVESDDSNCTVLNYYACLLIWKLSAKPSAVRERNSVCRNQRS